MIDIEYANTPTERKNETNKEEEFENNLQFIQNILEQKNNKIIENADQIPKMLDIAFLDFLEQNKTTHEKLFHDIYKNTITILSTKNSLLDKEDKQSLETLKIFLEPYWWHTKDYSGLTYTDQGEKEKYNERNRFIANAKNQLTILKNIPQEEKDKITWFLNNPTKLNIQNLQKFILQKSEWLTGFDRIDFYKKSFDKNFQWSEKDINSNRNPDGKFWPGSFKWFGRFVDIYDDYFMEKRTAQEKTKKMAEIKQEQKDYTKMFTKIEAKNKKVESNQSTKEELKEIQQEIIQTNEVIPSTENKELIQDTEKNDLENNHREEIIIPLLEAKNNQIIENKKNDIMEITEKERKKLRKRWILETETIKNTKRENIPEIAKANPELKRKPEKKEYAINEKYKENKELMKALMDIAKDAHQPKIDMDSLRGQMMKIVEPEIRERPELGENKIDGNISFNRLAFINKVTENKQAFWEKVIQISKYLKINPNWLMGLMNHESWLNHTIVNNIWAFWLIQFLPSTLSSLINKYNEDFRPSIITKEKIKSMSNIEQLDLVKLYFENFRGKIKSYVDLALIWFFPAALGKPNEYIFQTENISAKKIAKQNKGLDTNWDNILTLWDFKEHFGRSFK